MRKKKMYFTSIILVIWLFLCINIAQPALFLLADDSGNEIDIASDSDAQMDTDYTSDENLSSQDQTETDVTGDDTSDDDTAEDNSGVMLLSDDASVYINVPATLDEYQSALASGVNEFHISSYDDYINAQNLCAMSEVNGFYGITLSIQSAPTNSIWDLTSVEGFTGIGTKECPFRGTIKCFYENTIKGNARLYIDKPLIAYLGDGGTIEQLDIICEIVTSNNETAGAIAGNISGNVTISDVWIRGSI